MNIKEDLHKETKKKQFPFYSLPFSSILYYTIRYYTILFSSILFYFTSLTSSLAPLRSNSDTMPQKESPPPLAISMPVKPSCIASF